MNVLITGAEGFMGRNLRCALQQRSNVEVIPVTRGTTKAELAAGLDRADRIVHLAGVNRPKADTEFQDGNVDFTREMCSLLLEKRCSCQIIFTSSTQAELGNPYGHSKRAAEAVLQDYSEKSAAAVLIYRLTNVFGKWSRPNYNSVVATFCHNIARDLPIHISDPQHSVIFVHIDDVVAHILADLEELEHATPKVQYQEITPSYSISVGELADTIRSFRTSRTLLQLPDFSDPLRLKLYGTYLSYLEQTDFAYNLEQRCDDRGCLAEFVKGLSFGQFFVSHTKPGVIRGNHFHHTKTEKFLVLAGEAIVRLRQVDRTEVVEYCVRGEDFRVIDIPPGYTHYIENIGVGNLVTLFWASEIFDPDQPDTFSAPVHTISKYKQA